MHLSPVIGEPPSFSGVFHDSRHSVESTSETVRAGNGGDGTSVTVTWKVCSALPWLVRSHKPIDTARVELHLAQSYAGAAGAQLNPNADSVRELRVVFEPERESINGSKRRKAHIELMKTS